MIPWVTARRAVLWLVAAAFAAVLVGSAIETVTADPSTGEGWIGGPIQFVLAGGPLLLVSIGLRSPSRAVAQRTAVGAAALLVLVGVVLVAQLRDANEMLADRLVQAGAMLVYLAVLVVELPAFTDRWPPDAVHRPRTP